jgi:hypothetical protein
MAMVVYGSVAFTREQQNAHYIKSQVLLGTSASGSHRFLKSARNATSCRDVAATRCLALHSAIASRWSSPSRISIFPRTGVPLEGHVWFSDSVPSQSNHL